MAETVTCYAYRDKYGSLHGTKDEATAKKFAAGEVAIYEGRAEGGYPITPGGKAFMDDQDKGIFVWPWDKGKGDGRALANWDNYTQKEVKDMLAKIGI